MKNVILYLLLILLIIFMIIFSFNISSSKNAFNNDIISNDEKMKVELFSEYYDEAEKIMSNMNMKNKISQLFLVMGEAPIYTDDISYIGGFIYYSSFFKTKSVDSVNSYIDDLQSLSSIKYAIATDEEGGSVSRISIHKQYRESMFLSPKKLYKNGGLSLILKTEDEKDELLKSIQINLNLAPVADVSTNTNDFIYDRSLGEDAEKTAEYISEVTKRAKENGISTCLKHFPGYGNNSDSHYKVVIDERELSYLKDNDFKPFEAGIEAGTPFIMTSHNILKNVDNEYPTSLSKKVIDILKNDLNYSGIILTDDLVMDALNKYNDDGNAATLALLAGNDMLMTSNYSIHYNELINSYKEGKISAERINYSVRKIIAWKLAYDIIEYY